MSEGSAGGLSDAAERSFSVSLPSSLETLEALHSALPSRDANTKRLLWLLQLAVRIYASIIACDSSTASF